MRLRTRVMTRSTVLALTIAACTREPRPAALVGDAAPPYSATLMSGDSVSTTQLKGKVVLLNVWATWCAPCREEIPFLQALYDRHRAEGFDIVGVSVDARADKMKASRSLPMTSG